MQLQHVEAAALAALRRSDERRFDRVHRGAVHLARHLAIRKVRNRRRRHYVPASLFQWAIHAVPHQLGGALAAGVAKLHANFRRGIGMHKIHDAAPGCVTSIIVAPPDQLAFARSSSSGEFRYIPDMVSTQHRWS